MRRRSFMLLVCLLFCLLLSQAVAKSTDKFINVVIKPSPNGLITNRGPASEPVYAPASLGPGPAACVGGNCVPTRAVTKVKPPECAPPAVCGPAPREPLCVSCLLPKRRWGQFEFAAQLFYPRIKGTFRWPGSVYGMPTSEIDFNADLGIPDYWPAMEYSARFQFAPSWAIHYSIMTFEVEGTNLLNRSLNFGQWTFIAGTLAKGRWEFRYQKLGLLYHPICTPNAQVSLFSYWSPSEQRVRVWNEVCSGRGSTIDRTRNTVVSGMELQKCIKNFCSGGTLSCDNKASVGYLDDTLSVDVQTGLQFSVPMNCGRWGYLKGGYRYMTFNEDRPDLRLDTRLEGGFGELGLIF